LICEARESGTGEMTARLETLQSGLFGVRVRARNCLRG
jgi:hypothetical protein